MPVPLLSVVMPVYNAEQYIGEAIKSILSQDFKDYEIFIINDGSTDRSAEIIHSYNDSRIKVIHNKENKGNYPSRNIAMRRTKSRYICVMDADDICMSGRFEKQVSFMEMNHEVGIAGASVKRSPGAPYFCPSNPDILKVLLFQENRLIHPSLIIRKDFIERYSLYYNEQYIYSADYDMLVRAMRYSRVTVLKDMLLMYRSHSGQITHRCRNEQLLYANQIRIKQVEYLGIQPTQEEQNIHLSLMRKSISDTQYSLDEYFRWMNKLLQYNSRRLFYPTSLFAEFLHYLLERCDRNKGLG